MNPAPYDSAHASVPVDLLPSDQASHVTPHEPTVDGVATFGA